MFLAEVVNKCHENLLRSSSKLPLAYLVSRGLTLEDIKKYQIGYIPKFFENIQSEETEIKNFNKWLGYRGKFVADRIVFPVKDELGNIKGIETRGLDKRALEVLLPKYKESMRDLIQRAPESVIRYKKFYLEKSKFSAVFFGLPQNLESIWEKKEVFITEGIFDMISLSKVKPNCISPLTANINKYQILWLKRYVDKAILMFDMDKKGKESVAKIKEILGRDILVNSISLKNKDVNEFYISYGKRELELIINEKMDTFF